MPGVGGEPEKKTVWHIKTPEEVKGIYMTSWVASTNSIREGLVKIIEDTEINSVVIDIKDYTGKIAFLMNDSKILEIGSSENRIKDMKEFIEELHAKNVYVIGRIAVFQDPYLTKVRPDLAVKKAMESRIGKIIKEWRGWTRAPKKFGNTPSPSPEKPSPSALTSLILIT